MNNEKLDEGKFDFNPNFQGIPITYDDGNERFDALLVDIIPLYDFTFSKVMSKIFRAYKLDSEGKLTDEFFVVNNKLQFINIKHE